MSNAGDTYQTGDGVPWLAFMHGKQREGNVKEQTQWRRFEDEMPRSGDVYIWGKTKQVERLCVDLQSISCGGVFTHWCYVTVPEPPVEHVPESGKNGTHINHMVSLPGGEATPELIDDNFSQLYRKINEIIDAINAMQGSGK